MDKRIWRFPKIGVPPTHPQRWGFFHELDHPFWDAPIDGNPHFPLSVFGYIVCYYDTHALRAPPFSLFVADIA